MIYLKEKILNHSSRQLRFVVPEEPSDNEITVPTVHFIESATGNNVRVWQEEQSMTRNILGLHVCHMSDGLRQFLQSYLACLNAPQIVGWNLEIERRVEHWLCLELWVVERRTVRH